MKPPLPNQTAGKQNKKSIQSDREVLQLLDKPSQRDAITTVSMRKARNRRAGDENQFAPDGNVQLS